MPAYKIADVVFKAKFKYAYTARVCSDYLYTGEDTPSFSIEIDQNDIDNERKLSPSDNFPDPYFESLALYRKFCNQMLLGYSGIIFHCSAVAVDGKAYLFTAPSGTGKSTHARLWKEMLGDRLTYVNDDKPIIRYTDGDFYVYGTPWNGKHKLGTNVKVKIAAVCVLRRGTVNKIKRISSKDALTAVLKQTMLPTDAVAMDNLVFLIDKLLKSVPLYELECDATAKAAEISYGAMANLTDRAE